MTARKSLSALSSSPAKRSRYGDSMSARPGSLRGAWQAPRVAHTVEAVNSNREFRDMVHSINCMYHLVQPRRGYPVLTRGANTRAPLPYSSGIRRGGRQTLRVTVRQPLGSFCRGFRTEYGVSFPLEGVRGPDAGKGKLTPPNVH